MVHLGWQGSEKLRAIYQTEYCYRAMLHRAQYCYGKLSVRPFACNAEVSWSHRLEHLKNNFMADYPKLSSSRRPQYHGSAPNKTLPNSYRNRSRVWKNWLWAYKTGNISETVKDRVKVTINSLDKVIHGLSIAAKMYDLEWPLRENQGHWFFKCRKSDEVQHDSTLRGVVLLGLRIHAPVHLYRITSAFLRLACDLVSRLFSEWFVFRSTDFGKP